MKQLTAILFACAIVGVSSTPLFADKSEHRDEQRYTVTYRVGDLPVWTKGGEFSGDVLMAYMQSAATPTKWESRGGDATMAPYAKKASVIVSASRETHEAIIQLLKRHRKE